MIRMTKLTDYGFILLTLLSYQQDGPAAAMHNARDLSRSTHLPLPMVSKILKALARGGILASHRGVKGGYNLARAPDQIKVSEIIGALEGPIAITECVTEAHVSSCTLELLCPIRVNWQRINRAVRDALDGITLEEMTRPLMPRPARRTGRENGQARERAIAAPDPAGEPATVEK